MKKFLYLLLVISLSAQAQVDTYDYLYFCDQYIMANTNNSVQCLQHLYRDLQEFKKNPNARFRHHDTYNCIRQPDEQAYAKIKGGPNSFYKTVDLELWKLYNDCYTKNAEIIAYIRLEDYKTDLDKGFRLLREMQQLQIAIGKARDKIAEKVVAEAKSLTAANSYTKPYQLIMNAIVHEDDLIRKLSQNFNEDSFTGFPKEEVLKSFLEMDDMLKTITSTKFTVPEQTYLRSCIEGLQLIQNTKQHSLDGFNNSSTFDAQYANFLYDNLQNYFNNDILEFYSHFCGQARLNYYPVALREYDYDSPTKEWPLANINYTPPALDSLVITKQTGVLPKAGFNELNDIVYYIDECVRSMQNMFSAVRSEGSIWDGMREGKMPRKNPQIKFDKVFVPLSLHALIIKESKHLPAPYRKGLVDHVNDVQATMLAMQEHLMDLSRYFSRGDFRNGNVDYIDAKLKTFETLYAELDLRKEKLFIEVRKVYTAYTPQKTNSWTTSAAALLKATDHSRDILREMDKRIYGGDQSPVSTTAIHDDQRDLIVNQLAYMKGILRIGRNSGLDPYTPYDYIPGYLKTLEEKVTEFKPEVEDKNKTYGDFLYMHNITVEQYNKFAELGLGKDKEANDPLTPVYILSYIRQPPKFYFEPPKPKEQPKQEPEPANEPEILIADTPYQQISFEGYPYNNLVLLLDVSASMNKPDRLPLLKWSFQQLILSMRKEDEVSIVIYSGKATLHLPPQSASDTTTIIRAIKSLRSDGVTNISDGMTLAYKTANKNFIKEGNNKIIIATDGEFKVSESLFKLVEKNSPKIVLSVFDFSQLPDPLKGIQQLAEKGNGNYVKVTPQNSLEVLATEARKEK